MTATFMSYRMVSVAVRKYNGPFSGDVADVLEMLCHLADQNSAEVKLAEQSRGRAKAAVTQADLEDRDWNAFVARLEWRQRVVQGNPTGEAASNLDADSVNEDDLDMLVVMVELLDHAEQPLALADVVRGLQAKRVLSLEFAASARAQTVRLLEQLTTMGRVRKDGAGRWVLA